MDDDILRIAAEGLADLLEKSRQATCRHCGRPNPVCWADLCPERLTYTCPFCRGQGIFHADDCVNRGRGPRHPRYRRPPPSPEANTLASGL